MKIAGRPLDARERAALGATFDAELLDCVRIVDGRVPFWLRRDMVGVTLGNRIHFRPGCYRPDHLAGLELLAHEITHVRQFRSGMTLWAYLWASRRGYLANRYEVEARRVAAEWRAAFTSAC